LAIFVALFALFAAMRSVSITLRRTFGALSIGYRPSPRAGCAALRLLGTRAEGTDVRNGTCRGRKLGLRPSS
jgi:hypothetical protein